MIIAFLIVSLVLLLFIYEVPLTSMNQSFMAFLLILSFLCLVLWGFKNERYPNLKKQYFKHSYLALLGIIIVFFQYPLDYVLGNYDSIVIWENRSIVIKTLALSAIGLISFLIGYLVYRERKRSSKVVREVPVRVELLVILASISLAIYFVTVNPLYLIGFYAVGIGVKAYYAITFFQCFIVAIVVQKSRNIILLKKKINGVLGFLWKLGMPVLFLITIYLASVMISGDRGPIIKFSVLILSSYIFVSKNRLNLKSIIVLILIGAALITFLGIVRNQDKDLTFIQKVTSVFNDDERENRSVSPKTFELARSARTLYTAVNYVPKRHNFFYGRFQIQELLTIVPFSGIVYSFFDADPKMETSSKYITWIRQGSTPEFGDGTSCMADFYLDFGLLGVIVGMGFYGYMMRYAEVAMYGNSIGVPNLFSHVFFAVYIMAAIYIARGTVLAPLADCVKVYLFLLLNRFITFKIVKN